MTHTDAGGTIPPGSKVPRLARSLGSPFGWRHVKGVAAIRYAVATWLVFLGAVTCGTGRWWGAAFFPVAAAVAALAYWMPRWKATLDAERLAAAQSAGRVSDLERSRAHVVDDAATRLRHIEQDLHDGAQAQMVAVVMKLGLARDHLDGRSGGGPPDLERVRELVGAAHGGAVQAIADLRDLARGIHPPALDGGLGPALATLAARSEVPVEVAVDLELRPSPAIETIAYFCVAELLTNAAKHGGAQQVTLEARHRPGLLSLQVGDDGAGGARLVAGGGLAGLAERVRTVDGRLEVDSPPGGPTVVSVELPSRA